MTFVELEASVFKNAVETGNEIFLMDVREEYEFEDDNIGGHNIPMAEVLSKMNKFQNLENIYIICKSGKRSKAVAHRLSGELKNCKIYSCKDGISAFSELQL